MAIAGPLLGAGALLTLAARDDRLHLREGVIVSESARLSDRLHITLPGAAPLPEAARVTIEEAGGGWARVRFGATGLHPSPSVRPVSPPTRAGPRSPPLRMSTRTPRVTYTDGRALNGAAPDVL